MTTPKRIKAGHKRPTSIPKRIRTTRSRGGRPNHEATPANRRMVEMLVLLGRTQDEMCSVLDIDNKTLRKHYRAELDKAIGRNLALVMQTAIMQAVGGPKMEWEKAIPSQTKYILQSIGGLAERTAVQHSGEVGTYDATRLEELSIEELKALDAVLSRLAPVGAAEVAHPAGDRKKARGRPPKGR